MESVALGDQPLARAPVEEPGAQLTGGLRFLQIFGGMRAGAVAGHHRRPGAAARIRHQVQRVVVARRERLCRALRDRTALEP